MFCLSIIEVYGSVINAAGYELNNTLFANKTVKFISKELNIRSASGAPHFKKINFHPRT